jgi:DNA-directed RNA polymerase specialized sigma24 family protein
MKERQFNDREIIEGIKNDNNEILKYIYENIKPNIVEYFESNEIIKNNIDDFFQVALIKIRTRLNEKEIKIKDCEKYILKSVINEWNIENRNIIKEQSDLEKYVHYKDIIEIWNENEDEKDIEKNDEKERSLLLLILKCFKLLQTDCKKIFLLKSEGNSYIEIAKRMKLSEGYIRIKRKRCFEYFRNIYEKAIENENKKQIF